MGILVSSPSIQIDLDYEGCCFILQENNFKSIWESEYNPSFYQSRLFRIQQWEKYSRSRKVTIEVKEIPEGIPILRYYLYIKKGYEWVIEESSANLPLHNILKLSQNFLNTIPQSGCKDVS